MSTTIILSQSITEIKFEKSGKYGKIKEWGRNIYGSILKRWR